MKFAGRVFMPLRVRRWNRPVGPRVSLRARESDGARGLHIQSAGSQEISMKHRIAWAAFALAAFGAGNAAARDVIV